MVMSWKVLSGGLAMALVSTLGVVLGVVLIGGSATGSGSPAPPSGAGTSGKRVIHTIGGC